MVKDGWNVNGRIKNLLMVKAIAPHSIVKKENLQRIVDHYDNQRPKIIKVQPTTNELLHGSNTKTFANN